MPKTPSSTSRPQRTPLPPSMLDQMEAMIRHPTFQRLLLLWQSIDSKTGVGLTVEEEQEMGAPRTNIRLAAIQEAQDRWLSRSIRQIREQGEAAWAIEAINEPWGDDAKTMNVRVPGDLPPEKVGRALASYIRAQRKTLGLVATQRPRPHKLDKWLVYDLRKHGLKWWSITHWLFSLSGKTTYDSDAQAYYAQVRRAYRAACALIHALDAS